MTFLVEISFCRFDLCLDSVASLGQLLEIIEPTLLKFWTSYFGEVLSESNPIFDILLEGSLDKVLNVSVAEASLVFFP